jgi:hypothetical protein
LLDIAVVDLPKELRDFGEIGNRTLELMEDGKIPPLTKSSSAERDAARDRPLA